MELPVFENAAPVGTLRVTREGLYTVFQTRLPAAPALTRLWLQDADGAAAPLGLLRPGPEGRTLRRRLTRLDCRALPSRPVRALALPADAPAPSSPVPTSLRTSDRRHWCGNPSTLPEKEKTDKVNLAEGQREGGLGHCRVASLPARTEEASPWQPLPDGSLIDPARRLLALPWAGGSLPAPARKITWNGREYWLFRY